MEKIINPEERWPLLKSSTENSATPPGEEDIDDEEEALSLCDLPQTHHLKENDEDEQSTYHRATETQDNFDFCFSPRKSEMCAADEVFFQGQILPLSRSISSKPEYSRNFSRSISRSESMDRYSSSGLISSRSSSISSGHSSTSGSGSGSGSSAATDPKSRPSQNPFQYSHPSPSPRLRNLPNNKRGIARMINSHNPKKSSSAAWNVFRLGLLTTPPEIAVHDLKNRPRNSSTSRTNFGSRNSTSTNSSSSSTTKKKRMLNPRTLLSACKCTFGAVDTVPSKVVVIKRSASDSECEMRAEDQENNPAIKSPKKRLSNHRTFEWLKQLSLEGAATDG